MSRTIWILSLTPITDEPRVRRQAEACHAAGWNVVVAGYHGREVKPEYWNLISFTQSGHGPTSIYRNGAKFSKQAETVIPSDAQPKLPLKQKIAKNVGALVHKLPRPIALTIRKIVRRGLMAIDTPKIILLICSRFSDKAAEKEYWR
jgi:hypothetical protein